MALATNKVNKILRSIPSLKIIFLYHEHAIFSNHYHFQPQFKEVIMYADLP